MAVAIVFRRIANSGYSCRSINEVCKMLRPTGWPTNCFQKITGVRAIYLTRTQYSMDRPKTKKGPKKIEINENDLAQYVNVEKFKQELQDAIEILKQEYITNVSLRSATGAIESLPITFEGQEYTVQDLAQINRRNPKVIALNFSNFPQTIPTVLEAFNNSGMNLNPQQDGTSIYVPIPKITKEHRENLDKNAKMLFNKCKEAIKDIHNRYIKKVELNNKSISVEQFRLTQMQIKAITDLYVEKAENMKNEKHKELLGDEK